MSCDIVTISSPVTQVITVTDSCGDQVVVNTTTGDVVTIQTVTPDNIVISEAGIKGDKGDPGVDAFYEHTQSSASATWTVTHSLNKYPSVTVVDSAGDEVKGDVNYTNLNSLTINFSSAFTGKAYLN